MHGPVFRGISIRPIEAAKWIESQFVDNDAVDADFPGVDLGAFEPEVEHWLVACRVRAIDGAHGREVVHFDIDNVSAAAPFGGLAVDVAAHVDAYGAVGGGVVVAPVNPCFGVVGESVHDDAVGADFPLLWFGALSDAEREDWSPARGVGRVYITNGHNRSRCFWCLIVVFDVSAAAPFGGLAVDVAAYFDVDDAVRGGVVVAPVNPCFGVVGESVHDDAVGADFPFLWFGAVGDPEGEDWSVARGVGPIDRASGHDRSGCNRCFRRRWGLVECPKVGVRCDATVLPG